MLIKLFFLHTFALVMNSGSIVNLLLMGTKWAVSFIHFTNFTYLGNVERNGYPDNEQPNSTK